MLVQLRLESENAGVIPVTGPKFTIGRGPDCQLRPRDASVSERHCELSLEGDRLSLRDFGSPEGTMVNGLRVVPDCRTRLRPGDRIRVGSTGMTVEAGTAPGEAEGEAISRIAESLLRRRLGPAMALKRAEFDLVSTGEVAGIAVHSVRMPRVVAPAEVTRWRRILADLAGRPSRGRLILDLRFVEEMSQEAAEVLLAFRTRVCRPGSILKICEVNGPVLDVIGGVFGPETMATFADANEAAWSRW